MTAALPYIAVFGSRFREELQYRAAALAGLVTQVVFGFIMLMVLLGFHGSAEGGSPMTAAQIAAYIWFGQALLGLLPWNAEPAAVASIRTGEVVQDLLRPVSFYRWWFARATAWRVVRTTLRCVPMVLLAMGVFPLIGLEQYAMPTPASTAALGWVALALVFSVWLSVALTVVLQALMLWTTSPEGVLRLCASVVILFTGNLVPLPLLPDWAQTFLMFQPFRGLTDTPARIYGGDLSGQGALIAIALSAFWCVVITGLGMWLVRRGLKRLEVAGG